MAGFAKPWLHHACSPRPEQRSALFIGSMTRADDLWRLGATSCRLNTAQRNLTPMDARNPGRPGAAARRRPSSTQPPLFTPPLLRQASREGQGCVFAAREARRRPTWRPRRAGFPPDALAFSPLLYSASVNARILPPCARAHRPRRGAPAPRAISDLPPPPSPPHLPHLNREEGMGGRGGGKGGKGERGKRGVGHGGVYFS